MEDQLQQQKDECRSLCYRLMADLDNNKGDCDSFFGGDIREAYVKATEEAINKAREIQNKLRNL